MGLGRLLGLAAALGLSIAGWSLVWFVLLGVFAMVIAARAPRLRDA